MADLNCIFIPIQKRFLFFTYQTYKLRPCVVQLLTSITKINKKYLQDAEIHNNLVPLPHKYAAITLGRSQRHAHISFVKSYFNKSTYTLNDITLWLEMLSHEVVHIKQLEKHGFLCFKLLPYLIVHAYWYIKTKSHDNSPLEIRPIAAQNNFLAFNRHVNTTVRPYALARVIADMSLTENDKIKQIKYWYKTYKATL